MIDVAVVIEAAEEDDGGMGVAVVHGGEPFDARMCTGRFETRAREDDGIGAEGVLKILAGGESSSWPCAPGVVLPAGEAGEVGFVFGVDEGVVVDAGGDEAGGGFGAALVGDDEFLEVPVVADAAGVGGGIDAGTPVGFGGAAAGGDVLVFAGGELGGFLDADDVVFEAEVGINVLFALVMAEDDAGAVGEGEDAAGGIELVGERRKRRWRRSSKFSRLDLPTLRRRRHLRPGTRWQSSAPIWARSQWVLPPPRAPP